MKIRAALKLSEIITILQQEIYRIFSPTLFALILAYQEEKKLFVSTSTHTNKEFIKKLMGNLQEKMTLFYERDVKIDDFDMIVQQLPKRNLSDTISSSLCLPLIAGDRTIGMIGCYRDEGLPFTCEDLKFFNIIANQAAVAIEQAILYKRLKELAITDGLTGLYNRRYFQKILKIKIKESDRYRYPLSLIMFDIDCFKKLNDTYGHVYGDKVLVEVAHIAQKTIREIDTIVRYGGDEFMVILPITSSKEAAVVAERLREEVNKCGVSISVGVATYPDNANTKEKLIM
jgi:diguanylate cyclase (GGDEF)-like protein